MPNDPTDDSLLVEEEGEVEGEKERRGEEGRGRQGKSSAWMRYFQYPGHQDISCVEWAPSGTQVFFYFFIFLFLFFYYFIFFIFIFFIFYFLFFYFFIFLFFYFYFMFYFIFIEKYHSFCLLQLFLQIVSFGITQQVLIFTQLSF